MVYLWHSLIVALMALSLLMGCASSPYVGTGALVGGGLGALTGAAIGHKNPWAGALIGGAVGTGLGAVGGYALQSRQAQPAAATGLLPAAAAAAGLCAAASRLRLSPPGAGPVLWRFLRRLQHP